MNGLVTISRRLALLVGVACLTVSVSIAESRLWVNARINGEPIRLAFDTGASHSILYKQAAERLNLALVDSTGAGTDSVLSGALEPFDLTLWGNTFRTRFYTLNLPEYLHPEGDGILGWGTVGGNAFWIDVEFDFMTPLREIPDNVAQWNKFSLKTNSPFLILELSEEGGRNRLFIDTGLQRGIALEPERWQQWKATHSGNPTTLDASFMPGAGLVVEEQAWADTVEIGPLVLENVPITKANPTQVALASPGFAASLGTAALKQLIVVVDGENDVAYVTVKKRPAQPYNHNRLGAVFVPGDSDSENDDLLARVADGSPAQLAGIQDGDVLLKVDGLDVAQWRSNPEVRASIRSHLTSPAGTELHLTLRREKKVFEVEATLRDIIGPKSETPQKEQ